MKLKALQSSEITTIYQGRMVHDFIRDELKELPVILKAVQNGIYECLGLFDDDEIIGYAFLAKQGKDYLLDYFAIYPEYRNKGLGSAILGQLREYFEEAGLIIGEVEDPSYTKDHDLKTLQTRRIAFYKRNECTDTGLRVKCFGVPFIILELDKSRIRSEAELWEMYQSFYRAIYSEEIVKKNIEYLGIEDSKKEAINESDNKST